ncbi:MAG: hypothetical protein ACRDYY_05550 [Acidimicrobiales bacterium]
MTETDDLAAALDEAAHVWPELSRAQLVVRLALEGHRAAMAERGHRREHRLAALRAHNGVLTGTYGNGYLEDLRADWPE